MLNLLLILVASTDPLASARRELANAEQSIVQGRATKDIDASKASLWFKLASQQADRVDDALQKVKKLDAAQQVEAEALRYTASLIRREFVDELLDSGSFIAVAKAGDPYKFVMTATRLAELAGKDARLEPMFRSVGCEVEMLDGLPYAKCR